MHPATDPPAPARLREPANRVSPRAPLLWGLNAAGPLVGVLVVLLFGEQAGWFTLPAWLWPAYALLALGYVLGMPLVRYRVHRWESTASAVYTQTGWLARERRIAPMSRVQTVDFDQSALGRLLGLATVTVTTASAAGPLQLAALQVDVALRLVDELTRRAEADQGDAT
ncbi:MAG TPA: PH domain-containing protein [Marmoricola sp.]|jgi:membrane protein YdbS with pleckstrin-like domain|nr:PH domain-containing protein [Marmoricola sp.]